MPHFRTFSWAQDEPRAAASSWFWSGGNSGIAAQQPYGKGGRPSHYNNTSRDGRYRHERTRSIPAIVSPEDYLPVPYAKPSSKRRTQSLDANMMNAKLADRLSPPSPLWLLPALPGSTYNPRHELQRRPSPTALSFSSSITSTPPLTPLTPRTPSTPTSLYSSFTPREEQQKTQFEEPAAGAAATASPTVAPAVAITAADGAASENPVYVLTLKTSDEIGRQMEVLHEKWVPADRLDEAPAHVTLFYALPASKLAQISSHVETLASRIKRFEISSGLIVRSRTGVAVLLETGEHDVRRIFVSLRTSWWEWLGSEDKTFKAHWTVQSKEEDPAKVDEAAKDTHRLGTALGWATGLVLWRCESDGKCTKEKEFAFARSGREREEVVEESDESDGWPIYW